MQTSLINTLSAPLRSISKFIIQQEKATGLSTSRFIQDTATNYVPKAAFARSKADLAENTFLEFSESALVYFVPSLIGEHISRKIFSKNLSKEAKTLVSKPAVEILKNADNLGKKVMPIKAAIALSALAVPLTEFTLNYFKNLLTLKAFKQGDFNNIANLKKNKLEDEKHQKHVEKSAKKNIKRAVAAFAMSLGLAALIAKKGTSSKTLQNISEFILAPGTKLFKNCEKKKNFINKYFSLDFAQENGKLALSKGQLTSCVLVGGLGYFGAAKDRGRQNFLETLFRFPLVGFYVITGSELFEKGFKGILRKNNKCKDIIDKNLQTPKFTELEGIAKNLAGKRGTDAAKEFKRLAKEKSVITMVPYLFSILVMGFFVAGVSNLFTKYRYKKDMEKQNKELRG